MGPRTAKKKQQAAERLATEALRLLRDDPEALALVVQAVRLLGRRSRNRKRFAEAA